MSQTSRGIFAGLAIALTLGAVPLALGRDLSGGAQAPLDPPATLVNRAAKTDRAAGVAGAALPTQTISLPLNGVSDTSVLVRVPIAQAGRSGSSSTPSWLKSGTGKRAVPCEPVVSVLTDLAKRLEPGRCVT